MYDVAVLGGGIAGMATAARLQAAGLTTVVLESHRQLGGCAGFFRRKGLAFDVGATTLVDFRPAESAENCCQPLASTIWLPMSCPATLLGYQTGV